jgi:hypothetical protein
MKDKPLSDQLRESLWRGRLTDADRARAAGRPEALAELELENRLNDALAQLPAAVVPSNFTARVLQAVDREEARAGARGWPWFQAGWMPRLAATAAVVVFAALSWQHHELNERRWAMAHSVAQVAESSSLPGVEALNNYEAIQRMSQAQSADVKLLALLQ